MRLICPNCGAQYEVAGDVIPDGGRDVQCSNCGHTWFESPGASEAAEQVMPVEAAPEEPIPEPDADQAPEPDPAPEAEPEPTPPPQEPQRRDLDPSVADILREEAEFEQAARQADTNTIETQTDLDLSQDPGSPRDTPQDIDEDRRSREARDRLARLRGEPEIAAAVGATMAQEADAPRRELLPDIEEINSTLRPDNPTSEAQADIDDQPKARSGFRRGFIIVVILALIALAIYVFAPQISAAVPQAEPVLTSYVEWVNGWRLWLDARVQDFIAGSGDAPADAVES